MQQETHMDAPTPETPITSNTTVQGTKDGSGAADNDQPYRFGRQPNTKAPFPFNDRQFARMLILRGRVRHTPCADDLLAA
jgi:hypothetical protein